MNYIFWENDKMQKKLIWIIAVSLIVILCIIGFVWQMSKADDAVKAQLVIEAGIVHVKHEGKWAFAQNGTSLYASDSVKTEDNASAVIILFKSSIIRLAGNTEVTLKEIIEHEGETSVSLTQDAGRTWNTVLKISGIDNYEVQTPTAIASIRGTSFDVNHYSNGTTVVSVVNGVTNVSRTGNQTDNDTIEVNQDESVVIDPNATDQPLLTQPLVKDAWILKNQQRDEEFLANVKNDLYERIEQYIPELKDRYGVTDDELDTLIDGYLLGYYDLPPETPDWIRDIIELS